MAACLEGGGVLFKVALNSDNSDTHFTSVLGTVSALLIAGCYTPVVIDFIGAPFDLCGRRLGSRLGPAALRLADIKVAIAQLGYDVSDRGDCEAPMEHTDEGGIRNFQALNHCVQSLRGMVVDSLSEGLMPVVMGGEHTLAVAGVSAALEHYGERLGLLWIDAHADIHTPGSSDTGNVHGMPLSALAGVPSESIGKKDEDWESLIGSLGSGPKLDIRNVAWFGLRDVDPGERNRLTGLPITMHEIDRFGIEQTVCQIDQHFRERGVQYLWISFDVDALDPFWAPGTGTAVRGGLSYREAHLCAELLCELLESDQCPYKLVGVDLVETNPLFDNQNETARVTVEWLASLLGKTILGRR